jgi:site-specific recombinase XerD
MDYIDAYIDERKLEIGKTTVRNYQYTLRQFEAMIAKPLNKVGKADVLAYIARMQSDGLERSTLAVRTIQIKTFYKWMVDEGHVAANPTTKVNNTKIEKKLPIYLTLKELKVLFQTAAADGEDEDRLVKMLYSTGARVSELVSIRKKDVNPENGKVKIMGKGSKERMTSIVAAYLPQFRSYLDTLGDDDLLFPMSARTAERHIKVLAARSGIKKHITPHKLRHSFATHMYGTTKDILAVQISLGHESLNTTQIYTHADSEEVHEKQNMLPDV